MFVEWVILEQNFCALDGSLRNYTANQKDKNGCDKGQDRLFLLSKVQTGEIILLTRESVRLKRQICDLVTRFLSFCIGHAAPAVFINSKVSTV